MLSSSKLVVALHILTILARHRGSGPVCSKIIADSVGTNPVVIRRIMTALESAGLAKSTTGRNGGFELSREARRITLAQIYQAVEHAELFKFHAPPSNSRCPVSACIQRAVEKPLAVAQQSLVRALARASLHEIADRVSG
jgi:Rrf2 family protein